MDLTEKKLTDGKQSGADYLCASCTYCHIQFDTVQKIMLTSRGDNHNLPPVLYPQLLGLSMGIHGKILGLNLNHLPLSGIEDFFFVSEVVEEVVREPVVKAVKA